MGSLATHESEREPLTVYLALSRTFDPTLLWGSCSVANTNTLVVSQESEHRLILHPAHLPRRNTCQREGEKDGQRIEKRKQMRREMKLWEQLCNSNTKGDVISRQRCRAMVWTAQTLSQGLTRLSKLKLGQATVFWVSMVKISIIRYLILSQVLWKVLFHTTAPNFSPI